MVNIKQILESYQDMELNEIISENSINRLNIKKTETDSGQDQLNKVIESQPKKQSESQLENKNINPAENQNLGQIDIKAQDKIKVKNKDNIIISNFGNMTQSQAIAKLIKKQSKINAAPQENSIQDIIARARDIASQVNNLEELEELVRNFDGCNLKKMATNTVFSDGDPASKIMVIGEAPGNHEDLQGIPFCGDSGKLLDAMFLAIGYPRQDLYITNTIFWRPPGNRKPTKDELAICQPFVEKHIDLIEPDLIILMGSTAMISMLDVKDPIGKVRGKFMDYNNQYLDKSIKAISLFHPSYLMRQPSKKRLAWEDLLIIKDFLNKNEG